MSLTGGEQTGAVVTTTLAASLQGRQDPLDEAKNGDDMCVGIHLDCEVCAEESLVAIPPQRARYGAIDCPECGSTYLVRLETGDEQSPRAAEAAG